MRRDLALVVDQDVPAARIEAIARRVLGELVSELRLFDRYVGEGIEPGKTSIAIGVTLRHPAYTLQDAEVSQHVDELLAALSAELGARLR